LHVFITVQVCCGQQTGSQQARRQQWYRPAPQKLALAELAATAMSTTAVSGKPNNLFIACLLQTPLD
jgi:hypothetical protein